MLLTLQVRSLDVDSQEEEVGEPLHTGPVYEQQLDVHVLPPEVHHELISL